MSFLISALPKSDFQQLFAMSADELASHRAVAMVADKKPGFPCRVSLADADVGEEVILVNYQHQAADSPFRASHAVFVRREANQARLNVDEVPQMLRLRPLSLRAFDDRGMLLAADLVDGNVLETCMESIFSNPAIAYIHIHFAKPGCYAACAVRA